EVADVELHVLAMVAQVENRIANELPRRVERGLPAAIGLGDLDPRALGNVDFSIRLGAPPDRDDARMLEKDHRLGDRALRDCTSKRTLELERVPIRHEVETQQVCAPHD